MCRSLPIARTTTSPELRPTRMLHLQAMGAAHVLGIAAHRRLHGQGRVAGPHGVVFMGEGGAEERHDAVARALDSPCPRKRCTASIMAWRAGSRSCLGLLPGPGLDQLRRALEVGKQHGDLLAFAFQRTAGGEDFLREIGRGVRRSRGLARELQRRVQTKPRPASSRASGPGIEASRP